MDEGDNNRVSRRTGSGYGFGDGDISGDGWGAGYGWNRGDGVGCGYGDFNGGGFCRAEWE